MPENTPYTISEARAYYDHLIAGKHDPYQAGLVGWLVEEVERLQADAARWQYVRDNLAQMHSPKMDGQHSYRLRSLHGYRGSSFDEAIDKAIQFTQDSRDAT